MEAVRCSFPVRAFRVLLLGLSVVATSTGTADVPMPPAPPQGRARSNSWPPAARIGACRWRPYENDKRKNSACSYQSLAMVKDALRIAITCSCQACLFFIPRSGRVRSFSTCGTAVEFFANISSVRAVWPADARATGNRFCFQDHPFGQFFAPRPHPPGVRRRRRGFGIRPAAARAARSGGSHRPS